MLWSSQWSRVVVRAVKKAECQRLDAFKLWCWRRLLRVPWTAVRSNQSILREINLNTWWKDWCWSSSILVIWWEQPTHWKSPWCWERLRAEGEESVRGWDGWMASPMQWTWNWANLGGWWGTERPGMLQSMGSQRVRHDWVTEQQKSDMWVNQWSYKIAAMHSVLQINFCLRKYC